MDRAELEDIAYRANESLRVKEVIKKAKIFSVTYRALKKAMDYARHSSQVVVTSSHIEFEVPVELYFDIRFIRELRFIQGPGEYVHQRVRFSIKGFPERGYAILKIGR